MEPKRTKEFHFQTISHCWTINRYYPKVMNGTYWKTELRCRHKAVLNCKRIYEEELKENCQHFVFIKKVTFKNRRRNKVWKYFKLKELGKI